ncbi:hypothetical protein R1sor_012093 [Riccia sorocarpa]|uniref:Pentatricopeptide repeat-containing protein n=1 Tax=Riccia sorocarpa TaxID=122646 RepID=A0ABD3I5I3_9MARC
MIGFPCRTLVAGPFCWRPRFGQVARVKPNNVSGLKFHLCVGLRRNSSSRFPSFIICREHCAAVAVSSNLTQDGDYENSLFLQYLTGEESLEIDDDSDHREDCLNSRANVSTENFREELDFPEDSDGLLDAAVDVSTISSLDEIGQLKEETFGVVVAERTKEVNSQNASNIETSDRRGKDLLVEFLEERTSNLSTDRTRRVRVEHRTPLGKTVTLRSSSPFKHRGEANPSQGEEAGTKGVGRISGFAIEEDISSPESLFPESQEASGKSDDGCRTGGLTEEIIKIARELPQNHRLEEFLEPFHGRVSRKDGNLVLRALGAEQLTWPLLSFFQWMRLQDPCLLDPRSFCVVFTYLGRVGMVDQALTLYRNMPTSSQFHSVQVYNALLAALARCDRGDAIARVLQDMDERKVERDTVTYSILITAAEKEKGRLLRVWSMFDEMLINGLTPDLAVFGSLIKAFCNVGYHKQASLVLVSMEKMGLMPNVIIYNTLIDAYAKAGELEEAEGLLAEMNQRGLQPTTATLNSLVHGYGMKGQLTVAEELIVDMQKQGLTPDVFTYTSLISAYGKQKLTEKAVNAFLRMRKNGIAPGSHTYTALINAYSEGGWHDRAEATFANMQREGVTPTIETFTAMLDAYRVAGKVDMVLQVWKDMKEEGYELTRITYNTLMDAFAKQGRFNEARDVMAEMREKGMEPDLMTYNMLLNAYGRGSMNSKFPKILKEMREAGFEPDPFTYCTLIYASLRIRDFTSAFKWEREMTERRQRPDPNTYLKMKHILNVKFRLKQENDRKAALGQLKSLRKKGRKNPQRLKTFKKEIKELVEGPLAGYKRPKKTAAKQRLSEKDKALWKRQDDDERHF